MIKFNINSKTAIVPVFKFISEAGIMVWADDGAELEILIYEHESTLKS